MAVLTQTDARGGRGARQRWARYLVGLLLSGVLACGVTDEGELPPDVQDPTLVRTPEGAMSLYHGALDRIAPFFERYVSATGILTDELAALPMPLGVGSSLVEALADTRQNPVDPGSYDVAHQIRTAAREARAFLAAYAPGSSPSLQGHMYAVEGYTEIFLADAFCSGIPLSTVNFPEGHTLGSGLTTAEIYERAAGHFDSAVALASDSARLRYFAAVGQGRALLALGRYADAAVAVAAVPDDYKYQVVLTDASSQTFDKWPLFLPTHYGIPSVPDQEGLNGLNYRSSADPRVPVVESGIDRVGNTLYMSAKYPLSVPVSFTIADGIEARLIEAEALLRADASAPSWITRLNTLRTSGSFDMQPTADPNDDPAQVDTLWHAGTGGVAGLRPLEDPGAGSPTAQVDLLFRERAFWLYLTGHRQGDMRRLIRQYFRAPNAVYPAGIYQGAGGTYGNEVAFPVPDEERQHNSKYAGCFHRNA